MRKTIIFLVSFGFILLSGLHPRSGESLPLRGDYLGQQPPGETPVIFGPGIVSTAKNELNCAFSPKGDQLFFSIWNAGQNTLVFDEKVKRRVDFARSLVFFRYI